MRKSSQTPRRSDSLALVRVAERGVLLRSSATAVDGFSRRSLGIRMEAFNFTNTPHLAIPDNNVGDGSDFMTITSVQDLGREGIDERQFRLGLRVVF